MDVDLRSEFEIARSTSSYKGILQSLPNIFVGNPDRLLQIVSIVSEPPGRALRRKACTSRLGCCAIYGAALFKSSFWRLHMAWVGEEIDSILAIHAKMESRLEML
ncbi:Uncharacterized protein Fot_35268 [Forsythia ovata]|uniref:Uncharacterized protein n=1 Tax=Forsythia ovata TaxID=205694 RepID=A0ABD1SLB4_9LAMI